MLNFHDNGGSDKGEKDKNIHNQFETIFSIFIILGSTCGNEFIKYSSKKRW